MTPQKKGLGMLGLMYSQKGPAEPSLQRLPRGEPVVGRKGQGLGGREHSCHSGTGPGVRLSSMGH